VLDISQSVFHEEHENKNKEKKLNLPFATIIISNYNGQRYLKESLLSLERQTYVDYEVIVVDANSKDDSVEMVKSEFPWVKLIPCNKRVGIGEALNIGIYNATGSIIILDYNNDEVAREDWLMNLINYMLNYPNAGVVGWTRLNYDFPKLIDSAGNKITKYGHIPSLYHGQSYKILEKKDVIYVDFSDSIAIRRNLLSLIGLFDEEYSIYTEDIDFCYRVRRCSLPVMIAKNAITFHHLSATLGVHSSSQAYFLRRGHIRFILKNFSMVNMFLALVWISCISLIEISMIIPIFRFIVKKTRYAPKSTQNLEQVKAIINSYKWNVKNMKNTMKARVETNAILSDL